jgi:YidC/Oxa1 family membrane protein insertase
MWTWLQDGVFWCVNGMYTFCGDWGLAIILITIIFRALVYPLTSKQTRSSYEMQRLQPKIQEIQTKYEGDKQRISEETMKMYADNKVSPLSGCLPMLLQMPIFIILFQVLRERIPSGANFYNLVPDLTLMPKDLLTNGGPLVNSIPYVLLVLIFGASMLVPMLIQKNSNNQAKIMGIFMSVFMLWIGFTSPAGVLLYWDMSSIIGIAQQLIIQHSMDKKNAVKDEIIEVGPIEVDVERKIKKPRPTKKG